MSLGGGGTKDPGHESGGGEPKILVLSLGVLVMSLQGCMFLSHQIGTLGSLPNTITWVF